MTIREYLALSILYRAATPEARRLAAVQVPELVELAQADEDPAPVCPEHPNDCQDTVTRRMYDRESARGRRCLMCDWRWVA